MKTRKDDFDTAAGDGCCVSSCCALALLGVVRRIGYPRLPAVYPQPVRSNSSKESETVSPKRLHGIEYRRGLPLGDGVSTNDTSYDHCARHNPAKPTDLATPEGANLIPIRCLSGENLPCVIQILRMNFNICGDPSGLNGLISSIPLRLFGQFISLELHCLLEEHELLLVNRKSLICHDYERRNLGRTRVAPSRITKPPHEFSERSGVMTASTTKVGRSALRVSPTNSEKDTLRCLPPRTVSNREVFRFVAMSGRYSRISGPSTSKRPRKILHNSVLVQWLRIGNWIAPSQVGISNLSGIGYQSLVIFV